MLPWSKGSSTSLIGAIHLPPLPGAAGYCGDVQTIIDQACAEAEIFLETGFDALIVENTHDAPYLKGYVHPETTAAMAVVCRRLKESIKVPLGVQVLAGANREALAVAVAAGLDFMRVEGFVYAHVGDEGIHEACAAELVRRRFELGADNVLIFADVKKKHSSHSITSDTSLEETARAARMFKADGIVVSGIRTGAAPELGLVERARQAVDIPLLLGSGVTAANLPGFARCADGLIIGSSAKSTGEWTGRLDRSRCQELVAAARESAG